MKKIIFSILIVIISIGCNGQTTITSDNAILNLSLILRGKKITDINKDTFLTSDLKLASSLAIRNFVEGRVGFKANLVSPNFSGTPTVPTPSLSDSSFILINSFWVKKQSYGQTLGRLTLNSIPYINSSGILIEDNSGLAYNGTNLFAGNNNSSSENGVYLNNSLGKVTASSNGVQIRAGLATGSAYDITKSIAFYNGAISTPYLKLYSTGTGPYTHFAEFSTKIKSSALATVGDTAILTVDGNGIFGKVAMGYNGFLNGGNVFVGYLAGVAESGNNKLYIANSNTSSPLIYGDFANKSLVINGGASSDTASAYLSIEGTKKGFLTPRVNTAQMNAMTHTTGLLVFNTDTASLFQYTGSIWQNVRGNGSVGSGSASVPTVFGRTGAIVASAGDYTFSQISATPTTLNGYGILNAIADTAITTGHVIGANTTGTALNITGVLNNTSFPALIGDISTSTGSLITTIGALKVTNSMLAGAIDLTTKVINILPIINGGTNQSTYTLGDILAANGTNSLSKVAGNITIVKQVLSQTGNGSISALPVWGTLNNTDISGLGALAILNTVNLSGLEVTGILPNTKFGSLTGDVTNSSGSYATTISNNVITLAKMQQIATNSLLGRGTVGTGNVEVITIGSGLILAGGILSAPSSVTSISIASANGFNGSVGGTTASPIITVGTSISGITKGSGGQLVAAVAGTDYLTPTGSAALLTSFPIFNQNTTGSAALLTTGRTIGITGDITYTSPVFNGSANVTSTATVTGINGGLLSSLSTGIAKITTGTGVFTTAIASDFPIFNQNTTGNAATVTTNANLTGEVISVGNVTTVLNFTVLGKLLTGFSNTFGVLASTDNIIQGISKLNGNIALKADLANPTFTGTVSGITAAMVGLGNVNNTSDLNKPISTADQNALNLKADLNSPILTGAPSLPIGAVGITQLTADSTTKIATTAFTKKAIQAIINAIAPADSIKVGYDLRYDTIVGVKTISVDSTKLAAQLIVKANVSTTVQKILASNVLIINTGNTTENTIYTNTIPANSIGVNGSFHFTYIFSTNNNNANIKTIKIKINGVQIAQVNLANGLVYTGYTILRNRNSLTSQIGTNASSYITTQFGLTGGALSLQTFNTGVPLTVTITAQNATGTDIVSMEALEILAIP